MYRRAIYVILVYFAGHILCSHEEYCDNDKICESSNSNYRYLFYDVNPPEGFNLRRDVYLRYAVLAYNLQKSLDKSVNKFKLVLPPWINLYHWKIRGRQHIPWSHFFDIPSLQEFAPVIEMHEFFQDIGMKYTNIKIDDVYILQHFEDMFKTGNFEDRMAIESCNEQIETNFFHFKNVSSDNIKCLSFHGDTSQLVSILKQSESKTILFDHAEVALHERFGNKIYWEARRSMRFNNELVRTAAEFRKRHLNSEDQADGTERPVNWRDEKPGRNAKGGAYLSVHFRRRDFVWGRPNEVPSIQNASQQIIQLLVKLDLKKVFIATDAVEKEYKSLENLLKDFEVYRFIPNEKEKYNEGQIAIIDQIICSHAIYFIGTYESTFSFRIQEEREIMGFPIETTFNRLCGKDVKCEKPSIWKIVY